MNIDVTNHFKKQRRCSINELHSACKLSSEEIIIGGYIKRVHEKEILWRDGYCRMHAVFTLFVMDENTEIIRRINASISNINLARLNRFASALADAIKNELIARISKYIISWYPDQQHFLERMLNWYYRDPDNMSEKYKLINKAISAICSLIPSKPSKTIDIKYLANRFANITDITPPEPDDIESICDQSTSDIDPWQYLIKAGSKYIRLCHCAVNNGLENYIDIVVTLNMLGGSSDKSPKDVFVEFIEPGIDSIVDIVADDIEMNRNFRRLNIPLSFYRITDITIHRDYSLSIIFSMRPKNRLGAF